MGFTVSNIGALAQALATIWGLSFAIMASGYGLVELPRYFYHRSNWMKRLEYLYFKIFILQNEKELSNDRCDELIYLFRELKRKNYNDNELNMKYSLIQNNIPNEYATKELTNIDITFDGIKSTIDSIHDKKTTNKLCSKINFLIKFWVFEKDRNEKWWIRVMAEIFKLQNVCNQESKYLGNNSNIGRQSNNDIQLKTLKTGKFECIK